MKYFGFKLILFLILMNQWLSAEGINLLKNGDFSKNKNDWDTSGKIFTEGTNKVLKIKADMCCRASASLAANRIGNRSGCPT